MSGLAVYVDPALGTNAVGKGTGPGANAYKTLAYAWSLVPDYGVTNWTVSMGPGTDTGALNFRDKQVGTVTLIGSPLTMLAILTATTDSVQGSGNEQAAVVDTVGGWAVGQWAGKLCRGESGANAGSYCIVDGNTDDTLLLCGSWNNPIAAGDTFSVLDWASVLSTAVPNTPLQIGANVTVFVQSLKISGATTGAMLNACGAFLSLNLSSLSGVNGRAALLGGGTGLRASNSIITSNSPLDVIAPNGNANLPGISASLSLNSAKVLATNPAASGIDAVNMLVNLNSCLLAGSGGPLGLSLTERSLGKRLSLAGVNTQIRGFVADTFVDSCSWLL